jgi:hypothetical protein
LLIRCVAVDQFFRVVRLFSLHVRCFFS